MPNNNKNLGKLLKQQRIMIPLTLRELAAVSGISPSHLGRIERGERFPSARILRKLAKPLGLSEGELFTFVGFLSPQSSSEVESEAQLRRLDPYVAAVLSQKSVETQRTVVTILSVLESMAKSVA